ncbi:mating-type protein ALPHA1/MAT-1/A-1, partial [Lasiosphaeria hispida]
MDTIMENFAILDDNSRTTTMAALTGMMKVPTKKVNGYIGYRSYYSPILLTLPQKERSPIITQLWRVDRRHTEWHFLCAVYSKIRPLLAAEGIRLQKWIGFAIKALGLIERHEYMVKMGWTLSRVEGG